MQLTRGDLSRPPFSQVSRVVELFMPEQIDELLALINEVWDAQAKQSRA